MNSNSKQKQQKNPLETLRELRNSTRESIKKDLINPFPSDIASQLFGRNKYSGEIMPGEAIDIKDVYTGKRTIEEKQKKQLLVEKQLIREQEILVEQKTNELRIQIKSIREEIQKIAEVTTQLDQETQIAAMQAPIEPSTYELFFIEKILEFLKSFRAKIEDANTWLMSANRRANRKNKNKWGQNYKKHGARYLLSGEHYVSRSAG